MCPPLASIYIADPEKIADCTKHTIQLVSIRWRLSGVHQLVSAIDGLIQLIEKNVGRANGLALEPEFDWECWEKPTQHPSQKRCWDLINEPLSLRHETAD